MNTRLYQGKLKIPWTLSVFHLRKMLKDIASKLIDFKHNTELEFRNFKINWQSFNYFSVIVIYW